MHLIHHDFSLHVPPHSLLVIVWHLSGNCSKGNKYKCICVFLVVQNAMIALSLLHRILSPTPICSVPLLHPLHPSLSPDSLTASSLQTTGTKDGFCHLTHEFSPDHYQMVYKTQPKFFLSLIPQVISKLTDLISEVLAEF